MKKFLPEAVVVVVGFSSPLLVGVYVDGKIAKSYQSKKKISESIDSIFCEIEKRFNIIKLIYAKGPGSFTALKLSYIFLKTYHIAKNIPFFATDSFCFTKTPIKAIQNLYFVKENGKIIPKILREKIEEKIFLPDVLADIKAEKENEPLYILPPV